MKHHVGQNRQQVSQQDIHFFNQTELSKAVKSNHETFILKVVLTVSLPMFLFRVFPHHVENSCTDEGVFNRTGKQELTCILN